MKQLTDCQGSAGKSENRENRDTICFSNAVPEGDDELALDGVDRRRVHGEARQWGQARGDMMRSFCCESALCTRVP